MAGRMAAVLLACNTAAALAAHSKQALVVENTPALAVGDNMAVAEDTADVGTLAAVAEHKPVMPEAVVQEAVAVGQQAAEPVAAV